MFAYLTLSALLAITQASSAPFLDDAVVATRAADGTLQVTAAPGLTPASQFETGSIGKWACTIAVLRMVDDGKLSLDDRISQLLPAFSGPNADDIRLQDLLANRSGLSDGLMPAVREDAGAVLSLQIDAVGAANRFAAEPSEVKAGSAYAYDLVNWILVQAILERASGAPIATLMDEVLFGHNAANLPDSFIADGQTPFDDAPDTAGPAQPLPAWLGCAGGMVTTPVDLLAFVDWVATEGLSPESLARLQRITTPEEDYGLGGQLRIDDELDETLFWLSGSNGPYKSRVAYRPSTSEAIAIMSAAGDSNPLYETAMNWLSAIKADGGH